MVTRLEFAGRRGTKPASSGTTGAQGRQQGFTLVEVLIVSAVMAILLGLALPNVRGSLARNQLLGQANELAGAFALARAEAVRRGTQAGVCSSSDQQTCNSADWADFALVYADEDLDGEPDNTNEALLKVFRANQQVSNTAPTDRILFNGSGFSTLVAQQTFDLCHENAAENNRCRRLTIQPNGSVTVTTLIN
jgi:type IV fimbrial biogenesis protein FimT